ncbi:MAG: hypothetical protein UX49_C0021G0022 [Candidatus Wolfebacteria bacterium GW2011_GWC2_46_275]|uniref:Uncharacterized protein n=2 Tax=Candidatus Wolfeibacteriota TaxID=1752735 RepID=A0A0G1U8R7_9BACT|nr:MAG: hypothetical protein UX49_C0021G0022 [Candidatus Wolfebacteria bacterium GW2011_GWC2_46_275]KKU42085.1 MAG: hypothetical protein UX58_C0003G0009 [Candidatus Wolfebacteria bacterium GW2011_GWB2_46_69]KKU53716.1 MAG: hypothetical protein UX76_C0011G0061 [Candidatus Wolfebacteria bacterium GW2011_GWC1_47_103]KKU59326.1 MAG: hypothetical protein UX83_C0006G0096 [Candidatus Wolfebacteria bacterium GW2011_GWE2_47_12]KKU66076.1 MAG: hypothetical protein UX90_C0001G0135 [Candidatus Wolfebacteri
MQNLLKNKWINIIAALMLFFAIGSHPYSYYQILRWVVCGVALYNAYIYKEKKQDVWMWIFGIMAVVFNPLFPFFFERGTWQNLDLIAGIVFVVNIIGSKKLKNK